MGHEFNRAIPQHNHPKAAIVDGTFEQLQQQGGMFKKYGRNSS
jgi:hypothetical protein